MDADAIAAVNAKKNWVKLCTPADARRAPREEKDGRRVNADNVPVSFRLARREAGGGAGSKRDKLPGKRGLERSNARTRAESCRIFPRSLIFPLLIKHGRSSALLSSAFPLSREAVASRLVAGGIARVARPFRRECISGMLLLMKNHPRRAGREATPAVAHTFHDSRCGRGFKSSASRRLQTLIAKNRGGNASERTIFSRALNYLASRLSPSPLL